MSNRMNDMNVKGYGKWREMFSYYYRLFIIADVEYTKDIRSMVMAQNY